MFHSGMCLIRSYVIQDSLVAFKILSFWDYIAFDNQTCVIMSCVIMSCVIMFCVIMSCVIMSCFLCRV